MTVRRSANFGTYFFVGFIGMLIGSVIGKTLSKILASGPITRFINLYGFAKNFIIQVGGVNGYSFTLNLLAILGIILAVYIYRRI